MLAIYSGTHVYSDSDDDIVFADAGMFGVHSVRPGTRTYRLPKPARVWDLTEDKLVAEQTGPDNPDGGAAADLLFRLEPGPAQ